VPDVIPADPSTLVRLNPEVPEKDRFCANCGEEVGRAKAGREGRLQGFCASCRQPFDLTPKLAVEEVVAGQYEVLGCLAHGGFGWIYLAKDRNVSNRWVVLKGLLDSGNVEARAAALAERQFLATMEHSAIVKIYNFVAHRGAEYIVMEFVGGKSLKTILKERRNEDGSSNPLPVEVALAYVHGILPAMSYLHDAGYLFCDFKPDNVIHQGNQLKLIDLGGVRRIGDNDGNVYGTVGFQAPEIATDGPSVSSDIYTVVRTLAVLCMNFPGYTKSLKYDLPTVEDEPLFQEFDSFYRLLQRGTSHDPAARFESIDEFSEQLLGVLREVVSVRTSKPQPNSSTLFTQDLVALQGENKAAGDWRQLPLPLIDPMDPAASFLTNLSSTPEQIPLLIETAVYNGQVPDSVETRLRRVRACLEMNALTSAAKALTEAEAYAPTDWRIRWYEGLVQLANKAPFAAVDYFDAVYSFWPGEIAPRLALAYALEGSGDSIRAAALYERCVEIDPGFAFAVFGMGRSKAAIGDKTGAASALAKMPSSSMLFNDAQLQRASVLLDGNVSSPTLTDITAAAAVVDQLAIDAKQRAELTRDILKVALPFSQNNAQNKGVELFGQPLEERIIRKRLESVYRELATMEPDRAERILLIDEANSVRPRTLF
jgi:serine/threonine-protein kinase PknG